MPGRRCWPKRWQIHLRWLPRRFDSLEGVSRNEIQAEIVLRSGVYWAGVGLGLLSFYV